MFLIFEAVDLFQSLWGNIHGVRLHTFEQIIKFLLLDRNFSCRLLYEIYTLTIVSSLSTINISMLVEILSW